jgi:hypothetical protein
VNRGTTKTIAVVLLVLMFFPLILAIVLGILVHPLFLLLLLVVVFTIPLVRAARG